MHPQFDEFQYFQTHKNVYFAIDFLQKLYRSNVSPKKTMIRNLHTLCTNWISIFSFPLGGCANIYVQRTRKFMVRKKNWSGDFTKKNLETVELLWWFYHLGSSVKHSTYEKYLLTSASFFIFYLDATFFWWQKQNNNNN